MSTIETSIKIVRFRIYMPLFYVEAVAKEESDVEKVVEGIRH